MWLPAPEDNEVSISLGKNSFIIPSKANPAMRCHQVFSWELLLLLQNFMRDTSVTFLFWQVFFTFKTTQPIPWHHGFRNMTIQETGKPTVIISCSQIRQASGQQLFLVPANLGKEITVPVLPSQWYYWLILELKKSVLQVLLGNQPWIKLQKWEIKGAGNMYSNFGPSSRSAVSGHNLHHHHHWVSQTCPAHSITSTALPPAP